MDESDNISLRHVQKKLERDLDTLMHKKIKIGNKVFSCNVFLVRDGKLLVRSQGTSGKTTQNIGS